MKTLAMISLAVLPLFAACSGVPQRSDERDKSEQYEAYAGAPVNSFSVMGPINGWHSAGRNQLVVWTGMNDAYLLRVDSFCNNLQFADTISVTSTGTSVQSGLDSVRYRDGFQSQRCRIEQIRPIDYKRMKADRKKTKEE